LLKIEMGNQYLISIKKIKRGEGNRPRPPGSGDIGGRSRKISDITFRYLLRRAPCGALLGFRGASRAAPPRSARPANRRKASDSL